MFVRTMKDHINNTEPIVREIVSGNCKHQNLTNRCLAPPTKKRMLRREVRLAGPDPWFTTPMIPGTYYLIFDA